MATTTAPIQLRSTYPQGDPPIGSAPKPLGKTPLSAEGLMFPGSALATHFLGPVVSGIGLGAAGTAQLILALQIDRSMGNFSVPVQFPGGSFLESINAVTYETGLAATVGLGTTQGATDLATVTLPAKDAVGTPTEPSKQLPLWDAMAPLKPFQAWLTVTGNTPGATGGAIVLITYARIAAPWSPNPSKR